MVLLLHLHSTKSSGDKANTERWDEHHQPYTQATSQQHPWKYQFCCLLAKRSWGGACLLQHGKNAATGKVVFFFVAMCRSELSFGDFPWWRSIWRAAAAEHMTTGKGTWKYWGDVGADMENRMHPRRGRKQVSDKRPWLLKEAICSELFKSIPVTWNLYVKARVVSFCWIFQIMKTITTVELVPYLCACSSPQV